MPSSKSLLTSLLAVAPVAFGATPVDDSECDCYVTNGTNPTYFVNHTFIDFRSLSKYAGVPNLIDTIAGNENATVSSDYFADGGEFANLWNMQKWSNDNETFPLQNTFNNLYIQKNDDDYAGSDTFLTMRTARQGDFQTGSEFESVEMYQYVSMRMHARTIGSEGACTAMFTYLDGGSLAKVQEADIEILTSGPKDVIHYTNQPSYTDEGGTVYGAEVEATLPAGLKWTDWATHRLDWTAKESRWYMDKYLTAQNSFQVPKDPAILIFNAWSNGETWTNLMPLGGVAYQQIQWIEVLSGIADKSTCKRVCSIDETDVIGQPVRVENNGTVTTTATSTPTPTPKYKCGTLKKRRHYM